MQSSLIGKIEKGKRYAQEPDRVDISELRLSFRGDNSNHEVTFEDSRWHCDCHFFAGWGTCSHVMALQRMFGAMLPRDARGQNVDRPAARVG